MILEKAIVLASALLWGTRLRSAKAVPGSAPPSRIEPVLVPPPVAHPGVPVPVADRPPPRAATEAEIKAAVRQRMYPRRVVSKERAAELLVQFMNAHDLTGYFTARELDAHWSWCMAELDIQHLTPGTVRGALSKHCLGQKRIKGSPEFAYVAQRNPDAVRPVLYKIPKIRTISERSDSSPDSPDAVRQSPGPDHGPSGMPTGPAAGRHPSGVQAASQRRVA